MVNTILFDLDGTLLQITQEAFLDTYFVELKKVFSRMGMDPEISAKAVWVGTKAMVLNDGSMLNSERFWIVFAEYLALTDEQRRTVESACDDFYTNEFNIVKTVMTPNDISQRLVRALPAKGYTVVLATNPLFPSCAVTTRLNWLGLTQQDFLLVTHYANSSYCKPNPDYYREVLAKIDRAPEHCLMVGNNTNEDMSAGALGIETFLVTDCLENEARAGIATFRHGTLAQLETYLMSLPDII